MANVVCVDDHTLILGGLRTLLDQMEFFRWAGEFKSPDLLKAALNQPHTIDIVLIDVFYNRENRITDIGALAQQNGQVKWVILSAYESPSLVQQAFTLGISAYLRKDVTLEELRHALDLVWMGNKNINYTHITPSSINGSNPLSEPLSTREMDIISLIVKGNTEQQIAQTLFISKHTVHSHRKNILKKLGLHSNTDIIKYVIENNLS